MNINKLNFSFSSGQNRVLTNTNINYMRIQ